MIRNPQDIKLVVQPLYITLHHDYVFEGPCRFGPPERLTSEYDNMMNAEKVSSMAKKVSEMLSGNPGVILREPICIDRNEEFLVSAEMLETMAKGSDEVDVYLLGEMCRMVDLMVPFLQKVKKPLVCVPAASRALHTIVPATLLAHGLEVYTYRTWPETIDQLEVMRVKKVLRNTRILSAARFGTSRTVSGMDNFLNIEDVTRVFGADFVFVNSHELIEQTQIKDEYSNVTLPGRKGLNPTAEDIAEMNRLTDEIMAGAKECHMTRDDVFSTCRFYVTVKKFMDYYGCNAFTMPCPDMCATRRFNQERYTPCFTHSLLGEMGFPSACEMDYIAIISMMILTNFSRSPAYMSNVTHAPVEWKLSGKFQIGGGRTNPIAENPTLLKEIQENGENILFGFHSQAKRNMKGFHTEKGEYNIQPFAYSGFGATIRYDFTQDAGQQVTMCRVDPLCKKIFVARGTVVAGSGMNETGCTVGIYIKVRDGRDYFSKQIMFGNHVPLVYGDCFDQVCELGRQLGLEVVTA